MSSAAKAPSSRSPPSLFLWISAQLAVQAIGKLHESSHSLLIGEIVRMAQPLVRPPVHPFRLRREGLEHICAAA
jgi:hypothetical protein